MNLYPMTHLVWLIWYDSYEQKWGWVHSIIRKTCLDPKSVSIIFRPISQTPDNRKIFQARGKKSDSDTFKSPTYYRFIDLSLELYWLAFGYLFKNNRVEFNLILSVKITLVIYEREGEMAQKIIEGDNDTCRHKHLILRELKIRTIYSSLIF